MLLEDQSTSSGLLRKEDPQNLGKESLEQETEGYWSLC